LDSDDEFVFDGTIPQKVSITKKIRSEVLQVKYLMINGKREEIPPFPHHKAYIYRSKQFFFAKGMSTRLTMGNFITLKELYKRHNKMTFGAFTNATLIDEEFANEMAKLGNLNVYISIEGTKEETDFRRGAGVYDTAIRAMDILRSRGIAFAFSSCYHSKNYKTIASDGFLDYMRQKGA
jgi:hypothetical protein